MAGVAYLDLAENLERSIRRSQPGTKLPSEHELASAHKVSRITTRAALQELERRHLVRRSRGSGTFVASRVDYRISSDLPPSFSDTIRRAGHQPYSHVLSVRRTRASAALSKHLRVDRGTPVLHVRRLSTIDDEPASLHQSWIVRADLERLRRRVSGGCSLYALLREDGFAPTREWYTAELDTVPIGVASDLDLEGRPQMWHTFSCNRCDRLDTPIELSESWMRADVVRVRFELGPCPYQPRSEGEDK